MLPIKYMILFRICKRFYKIFAAEHVKKKRMQPERIASFFSLFLVRKLMLLRFQQE